MINIRLFIAAIAGLATLTGLTGCGLAKNTKKVEAEVDRFHQHWNKDEFQAVFDEAHINFRNAQPASSVLTTFQSVKKNYGDLKSSKRRNWGFNTNNGITDIRIGYDSVFDHGTGVEEFVYRMNGEKPLLVSYDIASPETVAKREAEQKETREAKRKAEEQERKEAREARKKP